MKTTIKIPNNLSFSDLHLSRDQSGIHFDWGPIEAICLESGIDIDLFKCSADDNASSLILEWYVAHLHAGGEKNAVMDDMVLEVLAEDDAGSVSYESPNRIM